MRQVIESSVNASPGGAGLACQTMKSGVANALAAIWGAAEATLFFIVPDVFLSWLALSDRRQALIACLYALLGALVGGTDHVGLGP